MLYKSIRCMCIPRNYSLLNQYSSISTKLVDAAASLYSLPVTFRSFTGEKISLNAIYQDITPDTKVPRATVVAVHGAPGTHNDFKYIAPFLRQKGIRLIAVNYPGHGFTKNDSRLTWHNDERNDFVGQIVDGLKLKDAGRIIFLGHSRGGENALQLGVKHVDATIGIVMVNSPGLRIHKGISPWWRIATMIKLTQVKALQSFMYPLLNHVYNERLGLRVPSGEVAATAMLPLATFAFAEQKKDAKFVAEHKKLFLLYCFAGKDFLIEHEISQEFAAEFGPEMKHLICKSKDNIEDDQELTHKMLELFDQGTRMISTDFIKEGHFLQKTRASYVSSAIDAMVSKFERT